MPAIAAVPFVLKDMIFTVGTDSYEAHVSSVKFVPSTSVVTWQGGTPASSFTDTTAPSWTCVISYAQDWVTANSLAQYLHSNIGQTKAVVFKPQGSAVGKPSFAANVIIAPGDIGGDVNTVQTASVTLGVIGTPAKTANP